MATLKQTGAMRRALRIGANATLSRNFQLAFLQPILGRSDVEVILQSGGGAELLEALATLQLDLVLTNQPQEGNPLSSFVALKSADPLPGITETFYAVTVRRRFPNPLVGDLLLAPSEA